MGHARGIALHGQSRDTGYQLPKRRADLGSVEQRIDQVAGRPALRDCNVLMIYPRFQANNFWNYAETCKLIGAKCPTAPLGLITAAAMLPANWNVRLVNRNSENVRDEDFAWADMVMTGGMFNQQLDALRLIALAHQHGKPTVVGGPDATSSSHVYEAADFRVLGEVEDVIARFIAAWNAGERGGCFTAEKFQIDVSTTPAASTDFTAPECASPPVSLSASTPRRFRSPTPWWI